MKAPILGGSGLPSYEWLWEIDRKGFGKGFNSMRLVVLGFRA